MPFSARSPYYQPWHLPNGQPFVAAPGEDTRIYNPNGQIMAYHWLHGDQALCGPNGNLATEYLRAFDVPGVFLLITRLYQQEDRAKEFAPADTSITGVPF